MSRRLTKAEMVVRDKYTEIANGELWLKIDHQSFEIVAGFGDKLSVKWFRRELAIALTRLIEDYGSVR
jgi:hypothetical protein